MAAASGAATAYVEELLRRTAAEVLVREAQHLRRRCPSRRGRRWNGPPAPPAPPRRRGAGGGIAARSAAAAAREAAHEAIGMELLGGAELVVLEVAREDVAAEGDVSTTSIEEPSAAADGAVGVVGVDRLYSFVGARGGPSDVSTPDVWCAPRVLSAVRAAATAEGGMGTTGSTIAAGTDCGAETPTAAAV